MSGRFYLLLVGAGILIWLGSSCGKPLPAGRAALSDPQASTTFTPTGCSKVALSVIIGRNMFAVSSRGILAASVTLALA